jgi:hypothetical protein
MKAKLIVIFSILIGFGNLSAQDITDVLTTGVQNPAGMFIDDDELYYCEYIENGKIYGIDLNDASPAIEMIVNNLYYPYGFKIVDDYLYYMDGGTGTIWRKTLAYNSNPKMLAEGLEFPITLTIRDNHLYFTHYRWSTSSSEVMHIDLDDQSLPPAPPEIIATGFVYTTGIEFVNEYELYVLDAQENAIYSLDISGNQPIKSLLFDGLDSPNHFFLQEEENRLLFSEFDGGRISSISLNTTLPEVNVLLSGLSQPTGLFIYEGNLYFNQYETNRISKIALDLLSNVSPVNEQNRAQLYPSPATNLITVDNIPHRTPIHIFNLQGQRVKSAILNPGEALDINDLVSGTYYLQTKDQGVIQFIKQ